MIALELHRDLEYEEQFYQGQVPSESRMLANERRDLSGDGKFKIQGLTMIARYCVPMAFCSASQGTQRVS